LRRSYKPISVLLDYSEQIPTWCNQSSSAFDLAQRAKRERCKSENCRTAKSNQQYELLGPSPDRPHPAREAAQPVLHHWLGTFFLRLMTYGTIGEMRMGMLMIKCPNTGRAISTGIQIEQAAFDVMPVFFSRTFCPACRTEHRWFAKYAWINEPEATVGQPPSRTDKNLTGLRPTSTPKTDAGIASLR
jgi:hypothetical protein